MSMCDVPIDPSPIESYHPGLCVTTSSTPAFSSTNRELAKSLLVRDDALVEDECLRVEPAAGAGLADAAAVDGQVDRHLQRRERLRPDHLAAALPRAEPVAVQDDPAVHAESCTGEGDQVLDVAVRADRRHRRLQVVDADAVAGERLVVLVELGLEPAEVGVARGAGVVVLPLLRILGSRLVLGRARDEHFAQGADPLCPPAASPDLLDLVVEVGLVEHVVAERLAGLEPRQRLEHLHLVVLLRDAGRRVRQLDGLAVGRPDRERHRLSCACTCLLQHRQPPISRSASSICFR